MDTNVVFDTHAYIKSMTEAGAEPRLAEAIAQGQIAYLNATAATKTDIANVQHEIELLRKDTKLEIAQLKTELTSALADSQFKIIVWNVGALFAFGGLLLAAFKLL